MKKVICLILLTLFCLIFCFSISACSISNSIHINGNVEETVEVNSKFIDKGVTYPTNYTLITDGSVDTSQLGKQKIQYFVYASDGTLAKEMYRYVNIVDTKAPEYIAIDNNDYYVGLQYTVDDFLREYSDNYNTKSTISVSPTNFIFLEDGTQQITITLADTSNNVSTYTTTITVQLDLGKLIDEVFKSPLYNVSKGSTGMGSNYTRVQIDNQTSLSYYDSGSLHYLKNVPTNLGSSASIQISANYGEFSQANVSFHINSWLGGNYSVGFATIDATMSTAKITNFTSTINTSNLNTNSMIDELNNNLTDVLNEFQEYVKLHMFIELK